MPLTTHNEQLIFIQNIQFINGNVEFAFPYSYLIFIHSRRGLFPTTRFANHRLRQPAARGHDLWRDDRFQQRMRYPDQMRGV